MNHYVLWFLQVAGAILPILLIGLLLMLLIRRRRATKGQTLPPLSISKILLSLALLGDVLITLMLTLVSRHVYVSVQLYPLASWIEARNAWSQPLFEQLFLNIAVFVPFGALLVLRFPALRRLARTAGLSLSFSLLIECLQLIFRRGVFDVDDLLGNTAGGLLGGALVCIVLHLICRKPRAAFRAAIPPIAALLALLIFFGGYALQPYGNLTVAPGYPQRMRNTEITVAFTVQSTPTAATVYRTAPKTRDDAETVFAHVRRALSLPDDSGELTVYGTAIDWQQRDAGISLSYSLNGGSWYLYHAPDGSSPAPAFADSAAFADWLTGFGLSMQGAAFLLRDDGSWVAAPADSRLMPANPRIRYSSFADGGWTLDVQITDYITVAEEPILSPAEAIEQVRAGRFRLAQDLPTAITLTDIALAYRSDSKGFFQPVWLISADFDDTPISYTLMIPALK